MEYYKQLANMKTSNFAASSPSPFYDTYSSIQSNQMPLDVINRPSNYI